ncbi:uncharacterized protein LOC125021488 [Mugil cephalus]|uniref:uncharacterized protein LOC125021488 n=1 Tax=Mugil cephalus TaxID=48193 RepID=UPI001FB7F289|nr:uncharacterized protein LOC125021488 [Mugil cephalus]
MMLRCNQSEMMSLFIFLVLVHKICQVLAVYKDSSVVQESGLKTAMVGETMTLRCVCEDDAVTFLSWYQQSLDGKPRIISTRMRHETTAVISPGYEGRFRVEAAHDTINNLIIKDLQLLDSATYYCGILVFNAIEFGQGLYLHVKAPLSDIRAVVTQSPLEPTELRLGDSVNLNCTVYVEPCEGELSLYWFRHGAPQPSVVFPSSGQCTNFSDENPSSKNCTSNLAIKSVAATDAGIYYCALASCGEIVFGDGTKLQIVGPKKSHSLLVYCLSAALALSFIVLLVLAFVMYKLKKKLCSVCEGSDSHLTHSAPTDITISDAHDLHYAALSLKKNSGRRHQEDNIESVCVYSRIKSRKE